MEKEATNKRTVRQIDWVNIFITIEPS